MAFNFDKANSDKVQYAGAVSTWFPITFFCRFRVKDSTVSNEVFSMSNSGTTGNYFRFLALGNGTWRFDIRSSSGPTSGEDGWVAMTWGSVDENWHEVVVVSETSSSHTIYFDGEQVATSTTIGNPSSCNRTQLGHWVRSGSSNYGDIEISEFGVWSSALDSDQRSKLFSRIIGCVNSVDSSNLECHWLLDKVADSINPASVLDSSGNDNHGEYYGEYGASVTGKINNALEFNKTNTEYVDLPTIIDAKGSQSMTVSCWINTTFDGENQFIIGTDISNGWYMRTSDSDNDVLLVKIDDGANDAYDVGSTALNDGNWHQVILRLDSDNNTLKGYVDGSEEISVSSASVGEMANDNDLIIGGIPGSSDYFTGIIDDVRIYDKALTLTEISNLYNSGNGTENEDIAPENLLAHYKMNDSLESMKVLDLSGNSNDATVTGCDGLAETYASYPTDGILIEEVIESESADITEQVYFNETWDVSTNEIQESETVIFSEEWTVSIPVLELDETITLDDSWNIETNKKDLDETILFSESWTLDTNKKEIDETVNFSESWTISEQEIVSNISKIISYNPLIVVTDSSSPLLANIDISDPSNPTWTTYSLSGVSNAKDIVYNSVTGYVYVPLSNGKVKKIDSTDFSSQTTIDTSDTDNLQEIDSLDSFHRSFTSSNDSNGEIIMIDESEITTINSDFRWLRESESIINTFLHTTLGSLINTDFRYLAEESSTLNTDFRWRQYDYDEISRHPITYDDWQVKINGTDLAAGDDVDLKSINITHYVSEKSTATFRLHRKYDNLDYDYAGNASEITNQNTVQIYIDGNLEFDGKISSIDTDSEAESVIVTAKMEQPEDKRQTISIPMSSLNENIHLYDCLVNTINIDNPYIDPDDENPEYYKGIKVDLGTRTTQQNTKWVWVGGAAHTGSDLAEEIVNGSFQQEQNRTYYWLVTFQRSNSTFYRTTSPKYIGTSLSSIFYDLWELTNATYRYQSRQEQQEEELGYYYVGSAPYNEVSFKNGIKQINSYYQDKDDGLYKIYPENYDYTDYAQTMADLEYEKLKTINDEILPNTSASVELSIDGYYYYDINLLTRINISNTTTEGIYKNSNGFPVSVKSITINSGTMTVSLDCDNQKSQIEIEEIEALEPDENSSEYIQEENETILYRKFDIEKWSYL